MDEEELFSYYATHIYRYLMSLTKDHHLAEDLLQETFYRAYVHIQQLTPEKIKPWLFRVAYNLFIDYIRKYGRISYLTDEQIASKADVVNVERKVITRDQLAEAIDHMESLTVQQKSALILRDFHQLSYEECASVMGLSLSAFKSALFRARSNLREKMNRSEHNEKG